MSPFESLHRHLACPLLPLAGGFHLAQRLPVEAQVLCQQSGVVVAVPELFEREGLVADDPVQGLDGAVIGRVEPTLRIEDQPGTVVKADQPAEFVARGHVPQAGCVVRTAGEQPLAVTARL